MIVDNLGKPLEVSLFFFTQIKINPFILMNRLKFHGPISQVHFPYSSSLSENISRSSCRLKLEMKYKIIIRSF